MGSTDRRLVNTLEEALSKFPRGVGPIKTVTTVQMKRRGEMKGLVGLTSYCCIQAAGDQNSRDASPTQTITFYSDLLDEISEKSAVGVVAHELAHAWLNEHNYPEASEKREKEADGLAKRWGYGKYLDALAAETEPV